MKKKIILYNLYNLFFNFIHIFFDSFFYEKRFLFVLIKIYIFLFFINNFIFFVLCFMKKKNSKFLIKIYTYLIFTKMLFMSVVFFYFIDYNYSSYFNCRIKIFNLVLSYFVTLFISVIIITNK